ncbi:MAG: PIN domain-containing protein [Chloroflexia bacterium]
MRVADALQSTTLVFLDTAPVIYFVEKNPQYISVVEIIFDSIDKGIFSAITSPLTLAESLVVPIRSNWMALQSDYMQLITKGINTQFVSLNERASISAAELRAKYNIRLIDALQIGVALETGCDAFLTNDAMLSRVTEIKVIMIDDLEP